MSDMESLFLERINRLKTTVNHAEPDRVPILSNASTWSIGYAGATVKECLENEENEFRIYSKAVEDFYWDGFTSFGITLPLKMYDALGSSIYFVSEDGCTIQHNEKVFMEVDEYDQLIEDPMNYAINVIYKRKYANLNGNNLSNIKALKQGSKELADFLHKTGKGVKYLRDNYGMPVCSTGILQAPLDLVFNFLRGFKGTMVDIRRKPDKVVEATESLVSSMSSLALGGKSELQEFPWIFSPLTAPTFLGKRNFEKFFWPSYKKCLLNLYDAGAKVMMFLEGNWENYYEFLNELPRDFALAIIEHDDIVKAKSLIGDKITLVGGMPTHMLKFSSESECVEYAKKIIDKCAPGGGFIFSTDKSLLSTQDVNPENLRAVNNIVHEYGVY